jgi:hypothetical protein
MMGERRRHLNPTETAGRKDFDIRQGADLVVGHQEAIAEIGSICLRSRLPAGSMKAPRLRLDGGEGSSSTQAARSTGLPRPSTK